MQKFRTDFANTDIELRSLLFFEEMKQRGAVFYALESILGFTNYFKMVVGGKTFRFVMLPTAEFASKYSNKIVADKALAKRHCKKGGFPVADGQAFWFWQNRKALQFGTQIGFPVVVKPRGGGPLQYM